MQRKYYFCFDRFSIGLSRDQVLSCSHQGDCHEDVVETLKETAIKRQLSRISDDDLKAELKETGGWSEEELEKREDNEERIIWVTAGNLRDSLKL